MFVVRRSLLGDLRLCLRDRETPIPVSESYLSLLLEEHGIEVPPFTTRQVPASLVMDALEERLAFIGQDIFDATIFRCRLMFYFTVADCASKMAKKATA